MSTLFNYLIILVLLVVECNSLNCYSCVPCGSSSNSWSTVSNSSTGLYCTKYVFNSPVNSLLSYVNRGISSTCTAYTDASGGVWSCCQTDYCNGSGSGGVSLSNSLSLVFALITAVCAFKRITAN